MRISLVCAVALSLLAGDLIAQRPDGERGRGRGRSTELRDIELTQFDAVRKSVALPSMKDGAIECIVYVPKSADAEGEEKADDTTKYPWAVWLHGLRDGSHRFHNDGGAETIDALRADDAIPPMIVVVPTVARQTLYVDGESNGDVEKALTTELVTWVEENLPAENGRENRAIMGVSMGGFGALKIAMRHPDVFSVVAAHSSMILPANPDELPQRFDRYREGFTRMLGLDAVFGDPIDEEKWAANMPLGIVRDSEPERFTDLAIYFDAITGDRYGFGPTNEELDRAMNEKDIAHTFRLVEGDGHSWGFEKMRDNLAHSFRFVGRAFRDEPTAEPEDASTEREPEPADAK